MGPMDTLSPSNEKDVWLSWSIFPQEWLREKSTFGWDCSNHFQRKSILKRN